MSLASAVAGSSPLSETQQDALVSCTAVVMQTLAAMGVVSEGGGPGWSPAGGDSSAEGDGQPDREAAGLAGFVDQTLQMADRGCCAQRIFRPSPRSPSFRAVHKPAAAQARRKKGWRCALSAKVAARLLGAVLA